MKRKTGSTVVFLLVPLVLLSMAVLGLKGLQSRSFDGTLDISAAAGRIAVLSDEVMGGRRTGTAGNARSAAFIKEGLASAGVEKIPGAEAYGQNFETVSPEVQGAGFTMVRSRTGETVSFELYRDYSFETDGYGGGIDYSGELLFLDQAVYEVPEAMIDGRVVVLKMNRLTEETLRYVLDRGGVGVLFYQDNPYEPFHVERKSVAVGKKRAETLFVGRINRKTYEVLLEEASLRELPAYSKKRVPGNPFSGSLVGTIEHVDLTVDVRYPLVRGENVAGWIPGGKDDACLVFVAHYDGVGRIGADGHGPAAVDNASGVAALLGLAETLSGQERLPSGPVVFLFTDGENLGSAGLAAYLKDPLVPLEKSEFIVLDTLGWKESDKTWIAYDAEAENRYAPMLAQALQQHFKEAGSPAAIERFEKGGSLGLLQEAGLPAVKLSTADPKTFEAIGNTLKDGGGQWSAEGFDSALRGLTSYLAKTRYGMVYPAYVSGAVWAALLGLSALIYVVYAVSLVRRENPGARLFLGTAEDWYYSSLYMLTTRVLYLAIPAMAAFLFIVFAVNVPPWFNLAGSDAGLKTNFSWHLTLKQAYFYIKGFGPQVLGHTWDGVPVADILPGIFKNSLILAGFSLGIAFFAGLAAGILRGMKTGTSGDLRGLGALALFSVPEVLVALLALYLLVPLSKVPWVAGTIGVRGLRLYVMPVLTLSLIPSIYFSRLVRLAVETEMEKTYVRHARALGAGPVRIILRHMMKGILGKAAAGIPALATVILSNLIVVEYLFGYPGMIGYLFGNRDNPEIVLTVCMLVGVLYAFFILLAKGLAVLTSPKGGC